MRATAFATPTFSSLRPVSNSNTISTSGRNSLPFAPKRQVVPTRPTACAELASSARIRPEPPVLHTCTPADLPALIEAAADAFHDDPVFQYTLRPVCSDERDYADTLRTICSTGISYALANPESAVVRADSQRRAVAVWYHPNGLNKVAQLGSAWRLLLQLGLRKFFRMLPIFVPVVLATPKQPYVYLAMIACCRDAQGKGLGSALMKEVIRECEERNADGYLESSNLDNTEFYNKRGFRNIGYVGAFGDDSAPKIMRMWRSA